MKEYKKMAKLRDVDWLCQTLHLQMCHICANLNCGDNVTRQHILQLQYQIERLLNGEKRKED